MVALAGATEDQPAGRQPETGSAKKKPHNASHSKRPAVRGARRKAREGSVQRLTRRHADRLRRGLDRRSMVGTARCAVRAFVWRAEWPFADAAAQRPYQRWRWTKEGRFPNRPPYHGGL